MAFSGTKALACWGFSVFLLVLVLNLPTTSASVQQSGGGFVAVGSTTEPRVGMRKSPARRCLGDGPRESPARSYTIRKALCEKTFNSYTLKIHPHDLEKSLWILLFPKMIKSLSI